MANDLFFSRDTKLVVKCDSTFFEIPVLDGFSFSQATNSSEVTLSEMESTAGVSRRGRKMFNDSMAPAEWSFSTYVRPFLSTVDAVTSPTGLGWDGDSAQVHAVEEVLWAALVGTAAFTEGTASADSSWADNIVTNSTADASFDTTTTPRMKIDFLGSNKSSLKELEIYFIMGSGAYDAGTHQVYKLSKAVVNSATVDFDIDGIATINWSGFASNITDEASQPTVTIAEGLSATNNFIRNRLTTLAVKNAAGSPFAAVYTLTLTGGSVSFENNITYLTPDTIGEVNSPIGHVTGTRTIGGNFTCYLSNSTAGSSDLFEDLASATTVVTNDFDLTFHIGGTPPATTIAPHMTINLPNCHLEIPAHSIEDVISIETTFSALPTDIAGADEAVIVYKGVAV
jgi:hypothetical protein|tara:strand:+ start:22 stop:1215 length:1194 start_codon:yes stop_codon:yes gene_type:complete